MRAAVEQALKIPLQADPRVVGGGAISEVGRGNDSANVRTIARADARIASALEDPINGVVHGYAIASLNDWLSGGPRIHASTVISRDRSDSTAWRACCV